MSSSYSAARLAEDDDLCIALLLPFLKHPLRTMGGSSNRGSKVSAKSKARDEEAGFVWETFRDQIASRTCPDWTQAASVIMTGTAAFRRHVKTVARSTRETGLLQSHMKKYLRMYSPSACFDLAFTKRYTGSSEACIIVTQNLDAGYHLQHLQGTLAPLTEDEDLKLKRIRSDFSILRSSRDSCSQLLLGPARFVNHDCSPNAEFLRIGRSSVAIRTTRPIRAGEEITISYGDHYFGARNSECRCATCVSRETGPMAALCAFPTERAIARELVSDEPFVIKCLCALAGVAAQCPHKDRPRSYEVQEALFSPVNGQGHEEIQVQLASRQPSAKSSRSAGQSEPVLLYGDIEIQTERHQKMYNKPWPNR